MWKKLWFNGEIGKRLRLAQQRGIIKLDHDRKRLRLSSHVMSFDHPWLHVGAGTQCRNCCLWKDVMFETLSFIPEFCRLRCYKVVAKIGGKYNKHGVREVIQLHGLMNALPFMYGLITTVPGKVGSDTRPYTDAPWSAYWYADGLEQGQEYHELISKAIKEHFHEDIPVILKQSCTEMERSHPSREDDFWKTFTQDERNFQSHIEDMFEIEYDMAIQPDWVKNHIVQNWLETANMMGDKSGVDFLGQDTLTVSATTFHKKEVMSEDEEGLTKEKV